MARIDLGRIDLNFGRELCGQPGGEKIYSCFTCLTCSASCPISVVNEEFSPARIIRMALYGFREEVLRSDFIWFCSSCYTCQERCPQGVSVAEFMNLLKTLAVKEGHVPAGVRSQMDVIREEGRIYPIDEFDNKKRKKAGLPPLPTSCKAVKRLLSKEFPK